jgi:adenosine/AMP kinase
MAPVLRRASRVQAAWDHGSAAAGAFAPSPRPGARLPGTIEVRPLGVTVVDLSCVAIDLPPDVNLVLGQAHFIKTVEDLHETLALSSGSLRFGVAFCEASGARLLRRSGNDDSLVDLATRYATDLGAGHCFVVVLREGYPVSVLNQLKLVPEVCRIYCATANPVEVVVAQTAQGRGILGVIDGESPVGVETDDDVVERKRLLRDLGYKL